jgi:very-short-patch-repair endonuclease
MSSKISFEKSFASNPKSSFWDYTKNIKNPCDILNNQSHTKYWFKCNKCYHSFDISLGHIHEGKWCCYCNSSTMCNTENCTFCYNKSFASNSKSSFWDYSENENIKPRDITRSSGKSYNFICEYGHRFKQKINNVSNGLWCSECCNSKRLCSSIDCSKCIKNSFELNPKSIYWDYSKNGNEIPRNVFNSSGKKYWFHCNICYHSFEITLSHINEGKWCSFCNGNNLCEKDTCEYCFQKSFASNEKSNCWISEMNEGLIPRQVCKMSGKKCWFQCDNCPHKFNKVLSDVSGGHWCKYCCLGSYDFCEIENCKHCFQKSFASHPRSKNWSNKNTISPNEITIYTKHPYWFDCDDCKNPFYAIIGNITRLNSWCPVCKNKTEKKLNNTLLKYYSTLKHSFRTDWCKNKTYLPYDFCIPEFKIIIELDGLQHFQQVMKWKSPEEQFKTDLYKQECANNNGFSTIRLLQKDVWDDKNDWLNKLVKSIQEIIANPEKIQNIYLSDNNEYTTFKTAI